MSPDKLVDENDPSMWVAKTKVTPVKFTKWLLFFLQGSYSQNHIKGRLWQEVLVLHWISLGPCPEVFKKLLWDWQPLPLLLVLHHNSCWCLLTASKSQCQSQKHLLEEYSLECVTKYVYLESTISEDGDGKEEIKRLTMATNKLSPLKFLWNGQDPQSKLTILRTCIFPLAIYGCEA